MASYTMTIAEMLNNGLTQNIFPSTYDFYMDDPQSRKAFEDKFIKHYYYREIAFETPFMFIQKLESHLLMNMPYWKQLYQTELACQNIDFLLNKDLTESTTRELSGVENDTGNKRLTNEENHDITSSSSANGVSTSTSQSTGDHKNSQLNDGVSNASLEQAYLTGVSRDELTSTDNQQSETSSNSHQQSSGRGTQSQEETNRRENTQSETITFKSQGNIGVTSSAELLQKWRDVLINMDKIIIESCNDLFMKIY